MKKTVTITATFTAQEAEAYAQFLKRVGLDDCERRAGDREEAYLAQDTGLAIQQALAEQGFSPR